MKIKIITGLLITNLFVFNVFADNPSTLMLVDSCAGCHGTDGYSKGPAAPTIAGLNKEYLQEQMQAFKDDSITSTVMGRIAKGYSDEEISRMVDYFAKKAYESARQYTDSKKVVLGRKLHNKYCKKCHEANPYVTNEKDQGYAVIVAGQWAPYLQYVLRDFINEKRKNPGKMKTRLNKMYKKYGNDGVEALAHFYGSR